MGDLILAQFSSCISAEFDDDAERSIKNLKVAWNQNIREKTLLHSLHHDDLSLEWDTREGLLPKVQLKENARSKTIDLQFRYPTGNARQSKVIGKHYAPQARPL
ncbi:hypothetical protein [Rhizobium oryzicola]|uniref:Uncharacterized protein n=1 Tax=Rhizobium oryzicola TaxID=1232668 RepID=A0ABT8SQE7_9HYPH|nr:hypothetical protein [Rhizobium oryzicola]MDO1580674.1 hypothetical protein [Rhizobium oryzicola]